MRKTIAQTRIDDMVTKGYKLVGTTCGWYSFRGNSNLSGLLKYLKLSEADVVVCCGARAGRHKNDGYELLVFVPA